jgi:glycosyltransferase involved in cell wall biosynthesis
METSPHISIIVPAFNLEGYIDKTLESIVHQTFHDWEVLVVDDGSTDNTPALIEQWAQRDSRIKLLRNKRSKGVSGARNTGIDNAQGRWISFLDGDDLFKENALEARVRASNAYPDCCFISGDFIKFDSEDDVSGSTFSENNLYWRKCLHGNADLQTAPRIVSEPVKYFFVACLTWTGCVMIRTHLIKKLHGFNEKFMSAEDDHLWLRVAASVDQMLFVPNSISYYRQRANSLTHSDQPIHRDSVAAYQDLLKDPLFSGLEKSLLIGIRQFLHSNTFYYRGRREKFRALCNAIYAVRWDFLSSLTWRNLIASLLLR